MEDLKVFVYELPSRFNSGWLSNKRCSSHLFAAEVAIHQALLKSSYRTLKPEEAHFFFVPIYATCNFSTVNGFPAIGHARPLFAAAVSHIASSYPFWNRSNGADHVFVATHDHGACFHTMVSNLSFSSCVHLPLLWCRLIHRGRPRASLCFLLRRT